MRSVRAQILTKPVRRFVTMLAVAGGLAMAGLFSAHVARAGQNAEPAAPADVPAPVGYWRMALPQDEALLNSATGLTDARLKEQATLQTNPPGNPPDNNVGWVASESTTKNRFTAGFDGAGDHIEVDANPAYDLSTEMTLAAWVKLANPAADQKIVGKLLLSGLGNRGYVLGVSNGQVKAEVFDPDNTQWVAEGGTVVADTWTHLAVTWQSGGQFIAYIDGTPVVTTTASAQPIGSGCEAGNGGCNVLIGAAPWNPNTLNVNGNIDEVLIFDKTLTADEIALLAQRTFIVASTDESITTCAGNNCALKTAIEQANAAPNGALRDRIHFDLPEPAAITPTAELAAIADAVILDGLTQPGASCAAWPPTVKVALDGSSAGAFANGLIIVSDAVTVRGLNVRNFAQTGIRVFDADDGLIECNLIGTDLAGVAAAPNDSGIRLIGFNNPVLRSQIVRNLISGNTDDGVVILNSTQNTIQGNTIGTGANGQTPLANGRHGIVMDENTSTNTIGGQGTGNVVAFNGGAGVLVRSGTGNWIAENAIHHNTGLGIDLDAGVAFTGDGVTANDPGDVDTGPNNLQNYPVLTGAVAGGAATVVTGTLDGTANTEFLVEFFANPAADADGTCEGETFVGFVQVTTNAAGNASVNTTLATAAPAGYQLSATATSLTTYDTSEFSACAPVTAVSPEVNLTPFQLSVGEGDGVATLTVTLSVSTSVPVTVNYSTGIGTATAGVDYVAATNQSVVVPAGQISATIALSITDDAEVEADEIFPVSITLPAGSVATLGPNTASAVTIVDDDQAVSPVVNLKPFQRTVGEGDGVATLTVTLSISTSVPVTVEYSTGIGTATTGVDYVAATNQSVVVPAGQISAPIAISITDDATIEPDELFPVSISLPAGSIATLGPDTASAVTIMDDDPEAQTVYLPLIAR